MVAVSAISFFFGLQLKTAQDLFNNSVSRDAESAREAWGPDERQRTLGRRNRRGASARRDRMRNRGNRDDVSYNGSSKVVERQKRRQKDARKFDDRNYDDFEPLPWTLPRPTPMRNQTSEEFMADYIAAKRKHNIPLPWEEDEKYADKNVSLPRHRSQITEERHAHNERLLRVWRSHFRPYEHATRPNRDLHARKSFKRQTSPE